MTVVLHIYDDYKRSFDNHKRLIDPFRLLEDEVVRLENSFTFAANKHALYLLTETDGLLLANNKNIKNHPNKRVMPHAMIDHSTAKNK